MGAQGVFQGFSFCGRHSREFGVWYIPGGSILNPQIPAFDITTLEIPSRDGGYFFGSKVRPRVFTLPCYIEEPPEAWPRIQAW